MSKFNVKPLAMLVIIIVLDIIFSEVMNKILFALFNIGVGFALFTFVIYKGIENNNITISGMSKYSWQFKILRWLLE